MTDHSAEKPGRDGVHPAARPFLWLDKTFARDVISLCVVLMAMTLLAVDFFVHRHEYESVEAFAGRPGFYVVFGFVSFAVAVLAGWPLRALLMRSPDYYDEPEDDDV